MDIPDEAKDLIIAEMSNLIARKDKMIDEYHERYASLIRERNGLQDHIGALELALKLKS